MSNINGLDNEFEFVRYLNGKKVKELNPLMREVIDDIFNNIDDDSIVKCWRNHFKQKSDIFIKINKVMKGISIKKGMKNSVHVEGISNFVDFLKENKVDDKIINEYLKYHFADDTIDGSGEIRYGVDEYKLKNQKSIDEINNVLNNKKIIEAAIKRFILKGNNSEYYIDGMICGEVDDFLWINRKDIEQVILNKRLKYSTSVHFGTLVCQPKNRCLNYNTLYEKDRYCIQIKWYSLFDDIIENMNNKIKKFD